MPSFSFILLMVSEKKNFEYFFENLPFMLPSQPIKSSRGLLNKHFCKKNSQISPLRQKKIANFHFSHYKSMGTISCHSNQSSLSDRNKKHNFSFPLPKDAMCVIWKESGSRFQRRCRLKMLTDDGRTEAGCLYIL